MQTESAQHWPRVLMFLPHSNPAGFQSPRIWVLKLSIKELRYSSSLGNSFSSAIFNPSSFRFSFINVVTTRATGSRSVASNIGCGHCIRVVNVIGGDARGIASAARLCEKHFVKKARRHRRTPFLH